MIILRRAISPSLRFVFGMLLIYGVCHALYFAISDQFLHDVAYPRLFGAPSVAVIHALDSDSQVQVLANRIGSPRAVLEVVRGYDGSGMWFLIAAAVLAFPGTWRYKIIGLFAGTALVYVLNVMRLVGLYFVAAGQPAWFLPLHTYFVPTLLIVIISLFFMTWAARAVTNALPFPP